MQADLRRLLDEASLLTLALALALGWSVWNLAQSIATFIDRLLLHLPAHQGADIGFAYAYATSGGALTWVVHRRLISLDGIVTGLIEVAAVLLVAVLVIRLRSSGQAEAPKSA